MTEESNRRAHERLDVVEGRMDKFEASLAENTRITKDTAASTQLIAENTTELVSMVKGIKGFRKLIVFAGPVVAAFYAVVTWWRGH